MRKLLVFVILCMLGTVAYSDIASKAYVDSAASDVQSQINTRANNYGYTPERVLQTDSSGNVTADLLKTGMISDGAVTNSRLASGLGLDKLDVGELPTSGKHIMIWNGTTQKYVFERYATSILPDGYTQLEYITCNSAWVDLPSYGTQNTEVECKASVSILSGTQQLFGSYKSTQGSNITANISPSGTWQFGTRIMTSVALTGVVTVNKPFVVKTNNQYTSIDTTVLASGSTNNFTTSNPMSVGRANGSSSYFKGNIYWCTLKESGELVHNLIPAKNSSGVIGMYDTVSETFFTNAGTGNFIAGPEI